MRTILITVMLVTVVAVIYNSSIGGAGGTKAVVKLSGGKVNHTIENMNP